MGISLDSAFKSFKKVSKTYYKVKFEDKFMVESDDLYELYDKLASEATLPTYYENHIHNFYNESYFEIDKKLTQRFVNLVKQTPESELKSWILQQEGKYIAYDSQGFYVGSELESVASEKWVGDEPVRLNEDGRLLMYAIDNLHYLYDIDLNPALIYYEDLQLYGNQDNEDLLAKFNLDSVKLGLEAEEKLKSIKKKDNDEFFEERMPRVHLLIDALKQGAKFVYSV